MKRLIYSKYFWPITLFIIAAISAYIIYSKSRKSKEYDLLMAAINERSNISGGAEDLQAADAFNVNYYKSKTVAPLWDKTTNIIAKIYDAKSLPGFPDDEQSVVDLFKKFQTQAQISYVSDMFQNHYGKNMLNYMESFMKNSIGFHNYMNDIYNIVSSLK